MASWYLLLSRCLVYIGPRGKQESAHMLIASNHVTHCHNTYKIYYMGISSPSLPTQFATIADTSHHHPDQQSYLQYHL